ncbi:MAG: hypothetical protein Q9210_003022 [Variospora velana]
MTRHVSHRPAGSSRFTVPSTPSRRSRAPSSVTETDPITAAQNKLTLAEPPRGYVAVNDGAIYRGRNEPVRTRGNSVWLQKKDGSWWHMEEKQIHASYGVVQTRANIYAQAKHDPQIQALLDEEEAESRRRERLPRDHPDFLRPQAEWMAEHEQRMERSMSGGGSSEQGSRYSAAGSPAPIDHHRGRTPIHQRGRRATRERDPYAIGRGRDPYDFGYHRDHYNLSPPPYVVDDHRGSRARRESNPYTVGRGRDPYDFGGQDRDPYNFNAPTYVNDNDHRGSRIRHESNPYDVRPVDHHNHHRRRGGRVTHSRVERDGGYIESTVARNLYSRGPMANLSTFGPSHTGASRAVRDPALRESTRRASRR